MTMNDSSDEVKQAATAADGDVNSPYFTPGKRVLSKARIL